MKEGETKKPEWQNICAHVASSEISKPPKPALRSCGASCESIAAEEK
jgi:hypothetical protein